ncbi:hypothetical protein LXJ15735_27730 [Lacrimispora xylanolytica]
MEKRICDICKEKEASRSYKVKQSIKGYMAGARWEGGYWQPYKKIDICGECAETLMGLPYRDSYGLSRPPHPPNK